MQLTSAPVSLVKAGQWQDVGHADRYVLASIELMERYGFRERHFNRVRIDVARGTIRKSLTARATAEHRQILLDEIEYYSLVPEKLRVFFPRLVKACTDWEKPKLEIEYYGYQNLADLFVFGTADPDLFLRIFERLRSLYCQFAEIIRPASPDALADMYLEKPRQRLEQLHEHLHAATDEWSMILAKLLSDERQYAMSGNPIPSLLKLIESIDPAIRDLISSCRAFCVIHGDTGFSNVLVHPPTALCRLVDPRGAFGRAKGCFGDQLYDIAKLNHSIEGYDLIVNDMFHFDHDGSSLELTLHAPENHDTIRQRFERVFFSAGGFDPQQVQLATGLLFASMLPLHDVPKRQLAMYLTAVRLLRPFA